MRVEAHDVVDLFVRYEGELHCHATHGPSGAELETDAPVDNHGRGQSFSPTDLVATALGTCMATVMGILADQRGLRLDGVRVHVKKHMTASGPRRIARLATEITFPSEVATALDEATRRELEHKAETCPVRLSLLDAIDVPIAYDWQG